ncbi:MAG: HEAT repeat domain-containing protein [Oscillospiraceae bacterium]|nr:HEAT repeat domain-containing protein [Oscillospiraceae bacterium]
MKNMKKVLAALLALTMTVCMASCGETGGTAGNDGGTVQNSKTEDSVAEEKEDSKADEAEESKAEETEAPAETEAETDESDDGMTKEQYASMTKEDLLAQIKDPENVTVDEMVWLISTYRFVDINDDPSDVHNITLAKNVTKDAIGSIKSSARPELSTYIDKLLESKYPQVRGYAISNMESILGVSSDNLKKAEALLENEEDPYVLFCAVTSLSNQQANSKAIHDFMMKMAESDNPKLRLRAAISCGTSWSKGVEGCVEAELKLMQDEDAEVKKTALEYCGGLNDNKVIEPLKAVLMDPEQHKFHSSAMKGIAKLWYDYPAMENTNEEAYKVAVEYLTQTPRTENVPNFSAVGEYGNLTKDKYEAWKGNASYFDASAFCDIMEDILKDPDANWMARTSAYKVIKAHDPERFKNLGSVIEGFDDAKAKQVLDSYNRDLAAFLEKEG